MGEAELIARAEARDSDAIGALYDQYAPILYRVAYNLMGSAADAEDVVHDVFVGLPNALKTFQHRGSFAGWLKRVTSRVALMKLRSRRIASEVSIGKWEGSTPAKREGSPIERMTIEDAINELPEGLRSVFVLKEVEGFSHQEIAKMLGIRPGASKARLCRARSRLRERLREAQ